MIRKILSACFIAIIVMAVQAPECLAAHPPHDAANTGGEKIVQKIDKLAIFPLKNLSDQLEALAIITPLIEKRLMNKGFSIIPYAAVDGFLNKLRIRNTSSVDKVTAYELKRKLGADAVLIGTIDYFTKEGRETYVGLTLRLVGTRNSSIIWMETLSYSGSDFRGLFGFGTIRSLDKLSGKVVSHIFKKMPGQYVYEKEDENFFLLGNILIDPPITTGGEEVQLTVRVIPVSEKPSSVRALVEGKWYDLKHKIGEYYDGTITPPDTGGYYPLDIYVKGAYGKPHIFPSASVVRVDMIPPFVEIAITKGIIGKWAKNKKDFIIFTLSSNEVADRWEVDIVSLENKSVRNGKGYGSLPRQLIWRGENNSGARNKDGKYILRLSVWDAAGNMGVYTKELKLDSTPPKVDIDVEPDESGEGVLFSFNYDESDILREWNFKVFDAKAKLIKEFSGKGRMEKKLNMLWPSGIDLTVDTKLMYTFSAIDMAGNAYETSGEEFFSIRNKGFSRKKGMRFSKITEDRGWGIGKF